MVFPQTPLTVLVELWIGGTWVDVTSDVYTANKIVISRGRADEGVRVDPGKCTLTFNNRSGKYSPRNPLSPYYLLIGRNTLIRVSVKAGTPFLDLPGSSTAYASTPDTAALDITGDLDVRIDATLSNWTDYATGSGSTTHLVGKLGFAGGTKSWFLGTRNRALYFEWSADGTATLSASSTLPFPNTASGRIALRATLDVDNGAGGRTVTFYTAPSGTSGPWTQFGSAVVQAGTTSIFNSATALRVGRATDVGFTQPNGRFHKAEVRSGIGGSVVAVPDFSIPAAGAGSFVDSAGLTWTVTAPATITNRRTRFIGEVSSWPSRWDVSGKDVRVPVEAAGILRRLGQGTKALDSTLRRRIPSYTPLAYWPMEEGASATRAYSPVAGVAPLTLTRATWASADTLASSNALPVLASSGADLPMMSGRIPAPTAAITSWAVRYIYRLDTANTTLRTFMRILSTGTVAEWYIQQRNDLTRIIGLATDGTTVFTQDVATGTDLYGAWIHVRFTATQNGGNVDWVITWTDVGGDAGNAFASFAGTVGRPTGVASPPDGYSADLDGMALGHISAWPSNTTTAYSGAIDAWTGETAGARMTRLGVEENLPLTQYGDPTTQEQVGPQRPDTLLTLFEEAADADGGILSEQRESVGLTYRDRNSLYNQPVALALNYQSPGHVAPPLEPVDDDQNIRNDITVQRTDGASARLTLDTGALSTAAPPGGVGVYDDSLTLNLYSDDQVQQQAAWRLHLGTVDEARYPLLHVDLAAAPTLIDSATGLDSGDRATIANPPAWLPPGPIDLLAQGYTETIGHPADWGLEFNCTPASPWTVGVTGDSLLGRADISSSELATGINSTALTLSVNTTTGPSWNTGGADFPFNIRLGGEVMTVSAISGTSNPQTFTISARSVNGIVKSHSASTPLALAQPAVIAQ
ncbi:hypothetical protein [Streptomyces sp. SID12501]|uniref:Uncharacterized protein n=1 Tax=Streptomyces sp. SID12501 TaxID=2706042 RepID=A0A6B3C1G0_9ACTN|nr:hypothetical protein [Streptomyces sp. SID12501]NEC90479.1 hypothetical protein [Streptomyces sp. SID12501]